MEVISEQNTSGNMCVCVCVCVCMCKHLCVCLWTGDGWGMCVYIWIHNHTYINTQLLSITGLASSTSENTLPYWQGKFIIIGVLFYYSTI